MVMEQIMILITIIILFLAGLFDVKKRIIPNLITFPAIAVGLLLTGIGVSANAALIRSAAILILFFLSMLHFLGMGDIKLLMAVIALQGIKTAIFILVLGSFLNIIVWIIRRRKSVFSIMKHTLFSLLHGQSVIAFSKNKAPFAPYACVAYITLIILNKVVLQK